MSDKLFELVDDLALAENFNEHDTARSALRTAIDEQDKRFDAAVCILKELRDILDPRYFGKSIKEFNDFISGINPYSGIFEEKAAVEAQLKEAEQERDSAERRVSNWIKRFSIEENKRIEFEHGRIPELEAQLKDAERLYSDDPIVYEDEHNNWCFYCGGEDEHKEDCPWELNRARLAKKEG